ncbi:MAG: hypothetical protein HY696_04285 [Deltaproteobacteria bacterium]|nr:hypothetical protein [Deltaproteobacteria bacterium]
MTGVRSVVRFGQVNCSGARWTVPDATLLPRCGAVHGSGQSGYQSATPGWERLLGGRAAVEPPCDCVCDNICDGICDGICDAICEAICDGIVCDANCDAVCDAVSPCDGITCDRVLP